MKKYVAVLVLLFISQQAYSAPIQWSESGHYYDLIPKSNLVNTWDFAREDAESMTFTTSTGEVLVGHLATITSAEEQDFIFSNWQIEGWLGGYQDDNAASVDSGWNWVTGELWSYTNWSALEPNDKGGPTGPSGNVGVEDGGENALLLWSTGFWNDFDKNAKTSFYYIEYESVSAVPVPAAAWLFASGIIGLIGFGRRKQASWSLV